MAHSAFENIIFFRKFFFEIFKKIFFIKSRRIMLRKGDFQKFEKKNFEKKIFFLSCFFSENRNKIAKNCSIKTMVTVPNRQDHEVFRKY